MKRKKFEYVKVKVWNEDDAEALERLGNDGWELCSVHGSSVYPPGYVGAPIVSSIFYFKREKL